MSPAIQKLSDYIVSLVQGKKFSMLEVMPLVNAAKTLNWREDVPELLLAVLMRLQTECPEKLDGAMAALWKHQDKLGVIFKKMDPRLKDQLGELFFRFLGAKPPVDVEKA